MGRESSVGHARDGCGLTSIKKYRERPPGLQARPGSRQNTVMTDRDRPAPPANRAPERAERLAAALRENLKRRKAQARAREAAGEAPEGAAPAKVAPPRPMG